MDNRVLSLKLLNQLWDQGVRHYVYCAGARNAPLVEALFEMKKEKEIVVQSFFEERSASFFALGLIQREQIPVAVLTTSGTAVAELLPACIEAYYSCHPLVLITADRPEHYRGSGAPQAICQFDLFKKFTGETYDKVNGEVGQVQLCKDLPTHINISFDEPLLGQKIKNKSLSRVSGVKDSLEGDLLILSRLSYKEQELIDQKIKKWPGLIYCESSSGFREGRRIKGQVIYQDKQLAKILKNNLNLRIIRVGGVPTARAWRDLENLEHRVKSFSDQKFSGLSYSKDVSSLQEFLDYELRSTQLSSKDYEKLVKEKKQVGMLLDKSEESEPWWVREISENLPESSALFLSNSLPIREWDQFSQWEKSFFEVRVNRGANGIDGVLSTFLGGVAKERENVLLVGDLTALYDLISLWSVQQKMIEAPFKIFILNNSGGQIFSRIFDAKFYQNDHKLSFKGWTEMFGVSYQVWKNKQDLNYENLPKQCIVEIQIDNIKSEEFWMKYEAIFEDNS